MELMTKNGIGRYFVGKSNEHMENTGGRAGTKWVLINSPGSWRPLEAQAQLRARWGIRGFPSNCSCIALCIGNNGLLFAGHATLNGQHYFDTKKAKNRKGYGISLKFTTLVSFSSNWPAKS